MSSSRLTLALLFLAIPSLAAACAPEDGSAGSENAIASATNGAGAGRARSEESVAARLEELRGRPTELEALLRDMPKGGEPP